MEVFQWVLMCSAVALIVVLLVQTRKRVKSLYERIKEYEEEQEAAKATPGPKNPYADLALLMQSDSAKDRDK